MSRVIQICIGALLLTATLSCSEMLEDNCIRQVENQGLNLLFASMETPTFGATKTTLLPDSNTMVWSANDAISLWNADGEKGTFILINGAGTTSGTFGGNLTGSAPYTAIFPASADAAVSEERITFKLPKQQDYSLDSFGINAAPMVATVASNNVPIQFKNLCGMLCLKLTSKPSISVSKIVISDLNGAMLWGDACLNLDGKEGTSDQTMVVSGGDDEIILKMSSPVEVSESTTTKFYVVVPPGSFTQGFSATLYDASDNTLSFLETHNPVVAIERATVSDMNRLDIRTEPSDPKKRGYYKDLFMDSGIRLNPFTYLAAFPYIGWNYEYFKSDAGYPSAGTADDATFQQMIFVSSDDDDNGYLLYPDRQPRYRCIYINGGTSRLHGESLGQTARKAIYDFVYNGGSYVGTCGGAFIACRDRDGESNVPQYIGIYPGMIYSTGIMPDTYTDLVVEDGCPLSNYYSIPAYITNIRHHQGGYMSEKVGDYPEGTEVFVRYSNSPSGSESVNGKVAIWAYKPDINSGRMVLCGSHPEKESNGDGRNLFSAMLLYAADGNGRPHVKAALAKGVTYDCTALSSAGTPDHARIGDKQYHHFTLEIPASAHDVSIDLASLAGFEEDDLYLSIRKDDYAWFSEADYTITTDGANKTLSIPELGAGTYFVSVYSPNTVTSTVTRYSSGEYFRYSGKTHLLNGIPYTITADWE